MKKLKLVIKQGWLDKIKSGEKTDEYREIKEFYIPRFLELKKPLSIHGIKHITGLFCYYWGLCNSRYNAIHHLLNHKEITIQYLKEQMENKPMSILPMICQVLSVIVENAGAGQINMALSNKDDEETCKLLFTTDPEMIPLVNKFIEDFDKEQI
jgi:hypothetical protein